MAKVRRPRNSKGQFVKKTRRNLDAFVGKDGRIHPIRSSKGYHGTKAGEPYEYGYQRK